ncbi:MAG: YitT family protein [Treponemataceae bacterium]
MKHAFNKTFFDWIVPIIVTAGGTIITAAGLYFFLIPTTISPGGVSGISIIINTLTGFPVKWMNLIINLPLFIFGAKLLGKRCAILTLISTLLLSTALAWFEIIAPNGIANLSDDMMLAALFGGIVVGLGLGMVFKVGGTTGGTDLAGAMISNRFPTFSIAKAMAVIDLFIVIMSGVVTKKPQTALYSLIAVFFCMRVPDMILDGFDSYKGLMIISCKPDELGMALMNELARGVTILKGAGMYSKQDKPVLLCVVHRVQITKAKEIINRIDEQAFIMVTDMKEVFGNGFLPVNKKK